MDGATATKIYDETDRANPVNHRRLARMAPLLAAAAVAVALLIVSLPFRSGDDESEGVAGAVSWLPSRLTPAKAPPPLPSDRRVGLASLIYLTAGSPQAVLVAVDGSQYRLPDPAPRSLSPDGRWLLSVRDQRLTLRDLTGTEVLDVGAYYGAGPFAAVWSTDGAGLVVQLRNAPPFTEATVVDLDAGRSSTVPLTRLSGTAVCDRQGNGDLVLCSGRFDRRELATWVVDGITGQLRSLRTLDLSDALEPAERRGEEVAGQLGDWQLVLADGATLALRAHDYVPDQGVTTPGDLLLFDIATGRFVRRIDLPAQAVENVAEPGGSQRFATTDGRRVVAAAPEGILLVHSGPRGKAGGDRFVEIVRTLELLDPVTGKRTVVTRVSGSISAVVPRGASL